MADFLQSIRDAFGSGQPDPDKDPKAQSLVAKMKQWNPDNTVSPAAATTDPTTGIGPAAVAEKQQQGTDEAAGAAADASDAEANATDEDAPQATPKPDAAPEAAFDARIYNAIHGALNRPETREDFSKIPTLKQRIDESLAPNNNPVLQAYGKSIDDINQKIQDTIQEKGNQVNKNEWAQVFDQLSQGLLQYAAGAYGMKHNLNLAGLKFSQTDWQQRLNNRLNLLNDQVDALKEGRTALQAKAGTEQQRDLMGAQAQYGLDVETEKNRAASERDINNKAITEAVMLAKTQQQTNRAETIRSQKLVQQGDAAALRDQEKQLTAANRQFQALQQATSILNDVKTGNAKDEKTTAAQLDKALGQAGLSKTDLGMNESHLWGLYTTQNPQAGLDFLAGRQAEAKQHLDQMISDKNSIIKKLQGQQGSQSQQSTASTAPAANAPAAQQAAAPQATGATQVMIHPTTGEKRAVPTSQVQAAQAAGYKLAQ